MIYADQGLDSPHGLFLHPLEAEFVCFVHLFNLVSRIWTEFACCTFRLSPSRRTHARKRSTLNFVAMGLCKEADGAGMIASEVSLGAVDRNGCSFVAETRSLFSTIQMFLN